MFVKERPFEIQIHGKQKKYQIGQKRNRTKSVQLRHCGHGRTGADHFAGNFVGRGAEKRAGCQDFGIARAVPAGRIGGGAHQIRQEGFFAVGGSKEGGFDRGAGNAGMLKGGVF